MHVSEMNVAGEIVAGEVSMHVSEKNVLKERRQCRYQKRM